MTLADKAAELLAAVGVFADVFDQYTCTDIGPKLTCQEAEAMWRVLHLAGCEDNAGALIVSHARSDEPLDMDHSHIVGQISPELWREL